MSEMQCVPELSGRVLRWNDGQALPVIPLVWRAVDAGLGCPARILTEEDVRERRVVFILGEHSSGLNAALLLVSADFAYDLFQAQQTPKMGLSDGLGDWWALLNGLPIGGETMEMVGQFQEEFKLNAVMASGVLDQLKLFDGSGMLAASTSMPVATTETRMRPSSSLLNAEPQMMFAS